MKKKNNNYLLKFLLISFMLFLIIYFTNETGYYEYKIYTKTKLTEESIQRFEQDIKNNKNVSTQNYIKTDEINYSNKFSQAGSKIGESIEKIMHYIIKKSLEILEDLFYK